MKYKRNKRTFKKIRRCQTKLSGFLYALHYCGILTVNFYVEMPDQIKKERIDLSHRIVDKNPGQMHPVPVWDDCCSWIDVL